MRVRTSSGVAMRVMGRSRRPVHAAALADAAIGCTQLTRDWRAAASRKQAARQATGLTASLRRAQFTCPCAVSTPARPLVGTHSTQAARQGQCVQLPRCAKRKPFRGGAQVGGTAAVQPPRGACADGGASLRAGAKSAAATAVTAACRPVPSGRRRPAAATPQRQHSAHASAAVDAGVVASSSSSGGGMGRPQQQQQRAPVEVPPVVAPPRLSADPAVWERALVLVDKPQGWTSHDVCAKLRSAVAAALGVRASRFKVGHAGRRAGEWMGGWVGAGRACNSQHPRAWRGACTCSRTRCPSAPLPCAHTPPPPPPLPCAHSPPPPRHPGPHGHRAAAGVHGARHQGGRHPHGHAQGVHWHAEVHAEGGRGGAGAALPPPVHPLGDTRTLATSTPPPPFLPPPLTPRLDRLGEGTPSLDADTEVTTQAPWEHVTDAALDAARRQFMGDIMQMPPMYSALKVGGKKLVDVARAGRELPREPRAVRGEGGRGAARWLGGASAARFVRPSAHALTPLTSPTPPLCPCSNAPHLTHPTPLPML